ncbi:MAG: Ig-like domain-containing protein [Bacteroidia bacterium]|nr:Ig-like domain-containing protein [Bacteroidia bacterium]
MRQLIWIIILVHVLLLGSCGQKGTLQGGPKDSEPPRVTGIYPEDSTLNYSGTIVNFRFSEAIKKPSYGKEIFISPYIKRPKVIMSDNARRLKIDFQEELRPQTTYIITLNEVKDLHEGNPLEETYNLAFSTGDQLDSMEIKGSIVAPEIGKTASKMTILLFDADSIIDENFFNLRPAYITKSNEKGDFSFKYLRNAPYRVLGLSDEDQSNTYNNIADRIAISLDSVVTFENDSTNFTTVKLFSYQPDLAKPRLMQGSWISDSTLRLRFNKGIKTDSLEAYSILEDSIGNDSVLRDSSSIGLYSFLWQDEPLLYLHVARGHDSLQYISLEGITDSLGKPLDTTFLMRPTRYDSMDEPLLTQIELKPEENNWEFFTPKIYREQETWFYLTDTARIPNRDTLNFKVQTDGFKVSISPHPQPDSQLLYLLHVSKAIATEKVKDSISHRKFPLQWYNPKGFSTVSGSVRLDSPFKPPIILYLLDKDKKVVGTAYDTVFSFPFLPAGTYSSRIILDTDSNKIWTPGSLRLRRPPEKIYTPSGTVETRENWDFPDFVIEVGFKKAEPKEEKPEVGKLEEATLPEEEKE